MFASVQLARCPGRPECDRARWGHRAGRGLACAVAAAYLSQPRAGSPAAGLDGATDSKNAMHMSST